MSIGEGANARSRSGLRRPAEESDDIYEGLVVDDARVSGSITVGATRLPLWAIIGTLIGEGWDEVIAEDNWPQVTEYGWTQVQMADFLYHLLQARGDFGRLLLELARVHRIAEQEDLRWYDQDELRQRVVLQLQRCLEKLGE